MSKFQKALLAVFVLGLLATTPADAAIPRFHARLCRSCAFGHKDEYCVKCGKWTPNNYYPAGLCNNCGFGSKLQYCVKCGKWTSNDYVEARLCSSCGFGNKKENCVKCGKWAN